MTRPQAGPSTCAWSPAAAAAGVLLRGRASSAGWLPGVPGAGPLSGCSQASAPPRGSAGPARMSGAGGTCSEDGLSLASHSRADTRVAGKHYAYIRLPVCSLLQRACVTPPSQQQAAADSMRQKGRRAGLAGFWQTADARRTPMRRTVLVGHAGARGAAGPHARPAGGRTREGSHVRGRKRIAALAPAPGSLAACVACPAVLPAGPAVAGGARGRLPAAGRRLGPHARGGLAGHAQARAAVHAAAALRSSGRRPVTRLSG